MRPLLVCFCLLIQTTTLAQISLGVFDSKPDLSSVENAMTKENILDIVHGYRYQGKIGVTFTEENDGGKISQFSFVVIENWSPIYDREKKDDRYYSISFLKAFTEVQYDYYLNRHGTLYPFIGGSIGVYIMDVYLPSTKWAYTSQDDRTIDISYYGLDLTARFGLDIGIIPMDKPEGYYLTLRIECGYKYNVPFHDPFGVSQVEVRETRGGIEYIRYDVNTYDGTFRAFYWGFCLVFL